MLAQYQWPDSDQPYTSYFPRADIYELITSDLLHQVIKGVFKDHLISWVSEYLEYCYGAARKGRVLDEIDRRSVVHLLFATGIHRSTELHLHPHSRVYVGSNRGGILTNGPETILRR